MPSWLPLLMPRPELFKEAGFPDLGERNIAEILTISAGRLNRGELGYHTQKSDGTLSSSEPPSDITGLDSSSGGGAAPTFVSLPIFTWCYIFSHGHAEDALHETSDVHVSSVTGYITRSFVTWMAGSTAAPLYRLDRMKWQNNVPQPDFSDLPLETPVQVILPFERTWGSAHQRMSLAAHLEPDLALLGKVLGWGAPMRPRRIEMPRYMA